MLQRGCYYHDGAGMFGGVCYTLPRCLCWQRLHGPSFSARPTTLSSPVNLPSLSVLRPRIHPAGRTGPWYTLVWPFLSIVSSSGGMGYEVVSLCCQYICKFLWPLLALPPLGGCGSTLPYLSRWIGLSLWLFSGLAIVRIRLHSEWDDLDKNY